MWEILRQKSRKNYENKENKRLERNNRMETEIMDVCKEIVGQVIFKGKKRNKKVDRNGKWKNKLM